MDVLNLAFGELGVEEKYNSSNLKVVLSELNTLGCIHQVSGMGYQITSEAGHAVLLHLHSTKKLLRWIYIVQSFLNKSAAYSAWGTPSSQFCQREMLFAALSADMPKFGQWRSQFFAFQNTFTDLLAQKLFATPAGEILFSQISSNIQGMLLFDLFSAANLMLEECTTAYEYAKAHVSGMFQKDFMLLDVFCMQAILRGEVETFLQEIVQQMGHEGYPDAIIKLLKGDFRGSADVFDAVQSVSRQAAGKRRMFLTDVPGFFYTVAQITNNTAQHLKLAKDQCDDGCKFKQAEFYPAIRPLIEQMIHGTALNPKMHSSPHPNLDNLFVQLACFWQNATPTEYDRHNLYLLLSQSQQHGYDWVAAEIDQLRQSHFNEALEFPDWHKSRQWQPLCTILQQEESWQRALSALSKLKTPTQTNADARIAWLIECESNYIDLEPREQKRSSKGIWSKGRAVALKRLSYEQESLPGILEQDKKIASCIRRSYDNYHGGSDYELNGEKALPFLIGHPAVFWLSAPDIKIDIVKGEPTLAMKQRGDTISLQMEPAMNADRVVWRKETPTRLAVYSSTPEIKQIASIIGKGLTVPSDAKEQLVSVIAAIAPHLAIHSDLPELAQHLDSIPADTTIYAHLLPLKEGLRIQFLMRPLPEGSWFVPGKGSANIVGEHQGKAIQACRNLDQEQIQINAVLKRCSVLTEAGQDGQEWELTHPETCLELLTELGQFKSDTPNDTRIDSDIKLELVWPEGERFRIKSTRSVGQLHLSIKRQGEWFVAGGEIKLDDGKVIALRELLKLASSATSRFLPLGENNFLALTDSFKKRLQELNALSESSGKDGVRVNHLAAPILAELADEVGNLKTDAAWKAQIKKLDALAEYVPQLPSTLQATLRDYQLEGYQWLSRLAYWGVGACLADDMGLGKTVQTLALLLERAPGGPALVVAPISVAMNWQSEAARFAPTLRVRAYHQNRSLEDLGAFDLVIASYGMLQQDAEAFAEPEWHTVVLDEAQVIKNSATKRSQAAMSLKANFRLIASGTPVENHLGELWNLFRFINPGLLGSKEHFTTTFSNPIERGDKQVRNYLKRLIQPFILRRTKTQVLSELPARTEIILQVELSDQERHMYEALRQEALDKIAKMKPEEGKSMQVLAEITKLRRFCCNPQLVMKNSDVTGSKLAVFAEVTEELLANKHKALVFSQFVDHLAIVRAWLEEKGISYQYLDGSTPPAERKKRVDAFQAGHGEIFLISLKAGGTGLNLTAADYVIHLDPWWNPAVEDQASDRAHRMGQLRPVTIYRLVTQQTIEEQIIALHAQKRDLADSLLEGGDVSGKLDTAALLRLLKEGI
jgi:superfamily II DNA or RNA helicase